MRHLGHGDPGGVQSPAVLLASCMVGILLGAVCSSTLPARGEGGDQVDVAVGVAVLHQAVAQPDDPPRAELVGEGLPRSARETSPGCGSGSGGTALSSGSFRGRRSGPSRPRGSSVPLDVVAERRRRQPSDLRVAAPGAELLAPGVEAEVDGLCVRPRRSRRSGRNHATRSHRSPARGSRPARCTRPAPARRRRPGWRSSSPARTRRSRPRPPRNRRGRGRVSRPTDPAGTAIPSACAHALPTRPEIASRRGMLLPG